MSAETDSCFVERLTSLISSVTFNLLEHELSIL